MESDQARGTLETDHGRVAYLCSCPRGATQAPWIVHLHELGEDLGAGEAWRNTWLQAGYAVLQLQTVEAREWRGQRPPSGPPGETRPPDDAGHEAPQDAPHGTSGPPDKGHGPRRQAPDALAEPPNAQAFFTPEALARQAGALAAALEQLQRSQEPLLARTRGQAWALTGFGLGGLLALRLAHKRIVTPASALLLLAPTLPFATDQLAQEAAGLRQPSLLITGGDDRNAYRPQTTAALREALFSQLPPGDRFLLRLDGGSHNLLSGSPIRGPGMEGSSGPEARGSEASRDAGGPSSGRGRGGTGGGGGPSGGGEGSPMRDSPRQQAQELAFAERIARAFLNAYVRDDTLARQWLREDANRWLAERALLAHG
ncbi:hypothetical protein [Niveibacterium sp. SC-1]|uniref:hypothetical protein n=1 Tax=Niveibacterium sp. SC-1 TaxID=3135646 RepID=UPI00311EEB2F